MSRLAPERRAPDRDERALGCGGSRTVRMIDPDEPARAHDVVARCALINADRTARDVAARLDPAALRTLDAIHLASALRVSKELGEGGQVLKSRTDVGRYSRQQERPRRLE